MILSVPVERAVTTWKQLYNDWKFKQIMKKEKEAALLAERARRSTGADELKRVERDDGRAREGDRRRRGRRLVPRGVRRGVLGGGHGGDRAGHRRREAEARRMHKAEAQATVVA